MKKMRRKNQRTREVAKKLLKRFFILIVSMFIYLFLGAILFRELENENQLAAQRRFLASLIGFLDNHQCVTNESLSDFFENVDAAIQASVVSITKTSAIRQTHALWDIPTSFFFSATVVTTIGYGNFAPTTNAGRIFCSFYALVGIPLFGWFLLTVGDALQGCWDKIRYFVHSLTTRVKWPRLRSCIHFMIYTILLVICLMIIPGAVFTFTEKWTFSDSVYYCFISLSTIGFGDLVAGDRHQHNILFWIQNMALVVWLLMGLSVMSMALKGMARSQTKSVVRAKTIVRNLVKKASEKRPCSCKRPSNVSMSVDMPAPTTKDNMTVVEDITSNGGSVTSMV